MGDSVDEVQILLARVGHATLGTWHALATSTGVPLSLRYSYLSGQGSRQRCARVAYCAVYDFVTLTPACSVLCTPAQLAG